MTDRADDFRAKQRRVAAGMAAALVVSIVAIVAALHFEGRATTPAMARLEYALRADTFVWLWLLAAIANVARLRFLSPRDIDGSGMTDATDAVRIGNAVLQNTLEQAVLAVSAHVSIALILPRPFLLITVLVWLFAIGRACFWLGYRRGAGGRAFGFALTFYPTVLTFGLAVFELASGTKIQG